MSTRRSAGVIEGVVGSQLSRQSGFARKNSLKGVLGQTVEYKESVESSAAEDGKEMEPGGRKTVMPRRTFVVRCRNSINSVRVRVTFQIKSERGNDDEIDNQQRGKSD